MMSPFPISTLDSLKMPDRRQSSRRGWRAAGFSLLEMMIVITIILILASIATARYEQSILRAREATLKQDLFVMRNAIQQYTLDKEAGPSSLDDMVPKYLNTVPTDPITKQKDWVPDSGPGFDGPASDHAGDHRCSLGLHANLLNGHRIQHLVIM